MKPTTMRHQVSKAAAVGAIFAGACLAALLAVRLVAAFNGPSSNPPSGIGAIVVGSNGYVGIGPTSSALGGLLQLYPYRTASGVTETLLIGTSSDVGASAAFGIGVTSGSAFPPFYIGKAGSRLAEIDASGNLTIAGTLNGAFTGTAAAGNVSAGTFGANTGNGDYTFPAALTVDATATAAAYCISGSGCVASWFNHGSQIYQAAGSATFTVPATIYELYIQAYGAGGGGGGGCCSSGYGGGGGGGGAGGYVAAYMAVTPGQQLPLSVGAGGSGGAGGASLNDGSMGAKTTFDGTYLVAYGGTGGGRGGAGGGQGSQGGGGAASSTASNPLIQYGGGGANGMNGDNADSLYGLGGSGGGVGIASGGSGGTASHSGETGSAFGGGGGGGGNAGAGGAGGAGGVIVSW
jgi:hypothetical protein